MTCNTSRAAGLGDRILDLDNPVYGDERQRIVTLEACALAFTVMGHVFVALAIVFAVTGAPVLGLVMFVLAATQALIASRYARSKGVDFQELVAQYAPRAGRRASVVSWVALVVFALAGPYWVHTGHGLLPLDWTPEISPGGGGDALQGALIGAVAGGAIGAVLAEVGRRKKAKTRAADLEADDLD